MAAFIARVEAEIALAEDLPADAAEAPGTSGLDRAGRPSDDVLWGAAARRTRPRGRSARSGRGRPRGPADLGPAMRARAIGPRPIRPGSRSSPAERADAERPGVGRDGRPRKPHRGRRRFRRRPLRSGGRARAESRPGRWARPRRGCATRKVRSSCAGHAQRRRPAIRAARDAATTTARCSVDKALELARRARAADRAPRSSSVGVPSSSHHARSRTSRSARSRCSAWLSSGAATGRSPTSCSSPADGVMMSRTSSTSGRSSRSRRRCWPRRRAASPAGARGP